MFNQIYDYKKEIEKSGTTNDRKLIGEEEETTERIKRRVRSKIRRR